MTPEAVDGISASHGVAEATRRLYDYIRTSQPHATFIDAVDRSPRPSQLDAPETVVAIAPAALYKEYRGSGADGRRLREAAEGLGLRVETIPLEPMGTLDENAAILVRWLRECRHPDLIIVSLSKGSSDVKRALASDASAFRNVSTWISVGGLLSGTPLARWLLSTQRFPTAFRALNRIRGVDFSFVEQVDRRAGGPLDFEFTLPAHLRLIHVIGFPLPEHATNWLARMLYRRLAADGPNDGFMLLKDALRWPGVIYPVWGADHYFRTRDDPRPLLEKLLMVALTLSAASGGALETAASRRTTASPSAPL